jgi:hypothetical protein
VDANGVTRREFDRLLDKVDDIDQHGSRKIGVLEVEIAGLREEVVSVKRALWWLIGILATGLITLVVTLGAGALGS